VTGTPDSSYTSSWKLQNPDIWS